MAKSLEEYPRPVQAGILAGLVILLGAVVAWYLVWPRAQGCLARRDQIRARHAQNAADRSFEQQRPLYRKRLEDAEASLADLRAQVPDDADPAGLVRLVHEAEIASGVHVRSLAVQPSLDSGVYLEVPVHLHVDGEYDALLGFFDRLGRSARITSVRDLALNVPGQGAYKLAARETVAADFVLSTYCNRAIPGLAGPAPAAPAKK
jgi:Tfp pilus assembly protein PilO